MNWTAQHIIIKKVGISRTMLWRLADNKVIEKRKLGKLVFFNFDEVQRLIDGNGIINEKSLAATRL
jgi:hypothetical protein